MSKRLTLTTGEAFEINEAQWLALVSLHQTAKQPKVVTLQGHTIEWSTILGLDDTKKSMYERMIELGCNMTWYNGKLGLGKESSHDLVPTTSK